MDPVETCRHFSDVYAYNKRTLDRVRYNISFDGKEVVINNGIVISMLEFVCGYIPEIKRPEIATNPSPEYYIGATLLCINKVNGRYYGHKAIVINIDINDNQYHYSIEQSTGSGYEKLQLNESDVDRTYREIIEEPCDKIYDKYTLRLVNCLEFIGGFEVWKNGSSNRHFYTTEKLGQGFVKAIPHVAPIYKVGTKLLGNTGYNITNMISGSNPNNYYALIADIKIADSKDDYVYDVEIRTYLTDNSEVSITTKTLYKHEINKYFRVINEDNKEEEEMTDEELLGTKEVIEDEDLLTKVTIKAYDKETGLAYNFNRTGVCSYYIIEGADEECKIVTAAMFKRKFAIGTHKPKFLVGDRIKCPMYDTVYDVYDIESDEEMDTYVYRLYKNGITECACTISEDSMLSSYAKIDFSDETIIKPGNIVSVLKDGNTAIILSVNPIGENHFIVSYVTFDTLGTNRNCSQEINLIDISNHFKVIGDIVGLGKVACGKEIDEDEEE